MSSFNYPLIEQVSRSFSSRFGHPSMAVARAPGRVNLLGEHVDYNDGFVMPAAIDRATYVAFSPSRDASTLVALDLGAAEVSFTSVSLPGKTQVNASPLPVWGLYPAGVAFALQNHNHPVIPINAVFASDVPRGSGLSSSASVEAAFCTAWHSLGKLNIPIMEQAAICLEAENSYVGVQCGIMDQFASLCGVENRLLQLDCRSLAWDTLPLPETLSIVIADTRVPRNLNTSAYNLRRRECSEAVSLLQKHLPLIQSLRDVSPAELEEFQGILPHPLNLRARHVVQEIQRTGKAKTLLEAGDGAGFGRLMDACHASLRDLYEVSCPELDTMVNIAQSLPGCLGARLTGAGFGGCTVNLVEAQKAEDFTSNLKEAYRKSTGLEAEVFVTTASAGAGLV